MKPQLRSFQIVQISRRDALSRKNPGPVKKFLKIYYICDWNEWQSILQTILLVKEFISKVNKHNMPVKHGIYVRRSIWWENNENNEERYRIKWTRELQTAQSASIGALLRVEWAKIRKKNGWSLQSCSVQKGRRNH